MKTRQKTKPLLCLYVSIQSKSKACKKCGPYHYPCLCMLEKKKKEMKRRRMLAVQAAKRGSQVHHQKLLRRKKEKTKRST